MNLIDEYNDFCLELCQASGTIIKNYFRTHIGVDQKNDSSPVTIADRECETKLRELIQKKYPSHGIIGEEFEDINADAEWVWVLDPIDGTVSFISGALSFGTLIALTHNRKPVLGVFYQPILNEYMIGDGHKTLLNGEPVHFRTCNNLAEATVLTTDYLDIKKHHDVAKFDKLTHQARYFRGWGDCYGYYLLASGYADIMIDPEMNPWDIMALIPIIEGAGGCITDYYGQPAIDGKSIVAAPKNLHAQVIKLIS